MAKNYFQEKELEVLSKWNIKKTLNELFSPDDYIFFKKDNKISPFIIKDNCCYMFGGDLPGNEYNTIDKNIINDVLKYLTSNNIRFKFTSLKIDLFESIDAKYKKFDVPFNQNWTIQNIGEFNIDDYLDRQKKKRRDKVKQSKKYLSELLFRDVENEEYRHKVRNIVLEKTIQSFRDRNKISCWEKNPDIFTKLFDFYFDNFKTINKVLVNKKGEIFANYNIIKNNNEIFLAFSNCFFSKDYPELQYLVYYDIVKTSSLWAQKEAKPLTLNAGRGNFNYKSRMGFSPSPMYAIVNDKSWKIKRDKDLSLEESLRLYKRDFGCFL